MQDVIKNVDIKFSVHNTFLV